MILSDATIEKFINDKKIIIEPYNPTMIQPASIDVCLGHDFLTYLAGSHTPVIRPANKNAHDDEIMSYQKVVCDESHPSFYLYPSAFVLATTLERVEIPDNILARLEGKSSLGRIGLQVHQTAGYIDPGFKGQITLELLNVTNRPIELVPGMPIGQLSFEFLDQPCKHPYGSEGLGSHYQNQTGTTRPSFDGLNKNA